MAASKDSFIDTLCVKHIRALGGSPTQRRYFDLAFPLVLVFGLSAHATGFAAADEVTEFFKSHPNAIDVEQRGDRILFANRHVGLEFRQSEGGFQLHRLYGIEQQQDYLVESGDKIEHELFELRMTLDPIYVGRDDSHLTKLSLMGILHEMAGDFFSLDSRAARDVSWRHETHGSEVVLHLEMNGFDVKEDAGVVDIAIQVTLRENDPLSRWRIAIQNRGIRYGIDRIFFPILPLAPIGEAKQNVFLFPRSRGAYVEDPFHAKAGFGYLLEGYRYYSAHLNMQFQALYDQASGSGIYLATHDPAPSLIQTQVINSPSQIVWRPGHIPPNHTYAEENYAVPYDCVVGPFRGDWFDACQIYRRWAVQQSWCRKGPLTTRTDVPDWYKKAPLFFFTMLQDSAEGTHSKEMNLRLAADRFIEFLEWADMKLPLQLYGWEQYVHDATEFERPTNLRRRKKQGRWAHMAGHNWYDGNYPKVPALPNLASECLRIRAAGGVVLPYTALELFDQGPDENSPYAAEAKPHITRDLYGMMRLWAGEKTWQPCAWTDWWRNRLTEMCVLLQQREHVGGAYLDVMQGGALPCYWVPHGHAAAGADVTTSGMHGLVEQVFNAIKAQDPQAIVTGENSTEGMIDVVDGILQVTLYPDNQAPLFATVYQDYVRRYGLSISTGIAWRGTNRDVYRARNFFIECASAFTEGMQIGMIRLPPRDMSLSFDKPEQKELIEFLAQIVGYYKQDTTSRFLSAGQLMRPLVFSRPVPMPMLEYKKQTHFPALRSGVFRADGDLGIFLANSSAEKLSFEAEFDPARHGLAAEAGYEVQAIAWDGATRSVHRERRGPCVLQGTLPGQALTMFHVQATGGR